MEKKNYDFDSKFHGGSTGNSVLNEEEKLYLFKR